MNKIEKIKKLADAMYNSMQNLTTDTSGIRKAMDKYHQFIINEYYKEDTKKDFSIKESVIPFGASDSELIETTYFIPQGFNAIIDGDKIILTRKESEDEKIRKELIFYLGDMPEDTELRNGVTNRDVLVWLEKQGEQKHIDYNEELKKCRENPLYFINKYIKFKEQKSTWNEDDMSKVQRICKYLDEAKKYYADINEVRECMDWLKSLKDRVTQSKQEWYEDDDNDAWMNDIISKVDNNLQLNKAEIDFLKSRKKRYIWKPSDEQMEVLYEETQKSDRIRDERIVSLYNDLKKLKGD